MNLKALLFILLFSSVFVRSQDNISGSNPKDTAFIKNIKPSLTISKCPNSTIMIDGRLDEPFWKTCCCARNFVEIDPGDNAAPNVQTEAYFTYDDDNLYVGFVCYDNDMPRLIAGLSDRDNMFQDDFVGVMIDTYNDKKQAYEVWSNAMGIQGDGIWTPTNESMDFDMIYQCDAHIYKNRWTVEFAIPFKGLRFPDKNIQDWNIQLIRTRFRESRVQYSWAAISRDDPEFFGQAGKLKGFKNIKKSNNLEILPYILGSKLDTLSQGNDPGSGLTKNAAKIDFGVGLKYGITSNLTGELVFNPDFSQVESDASQIDVNSASALFYPEKRPFFLEGSNIFSTLQQVIYTRLFNSPLLAGKMVGKIGKLDIGFLSIYDRRTPFIIPSKYGSDIIVADSLRSFSNVLRLKRDLKGESYLGLLITDREVKGGGYNRVLGFDGKVTMGPINALSWLLVGFDTKEMNSPSLYTNNTTFNTKGNTLTFDGEKFSGVGGVVSFDHSARFWSFGFGYAMAPPERREDLGYIANNDYMNVSTYQQFNIHPDKGIVLKFFPAINANIRHDYQGRIKEEVLMPNFYILFKKRIDISGYFLAVNNELYNDVYLKDVRRGSLSVDISTSNIISGGLTYEIGRFIARFGDPPFVGHGFNISGYLTLKPFNMLTNSIDYGYGELSYTNHGEKLYAGYIIRNETKFQFSKNLFLRLVMQYNSFSGGLDVDPLFSYKWNPFTVLYVGSTHNITNYGASADLRSRFVQTQRQFFAKFQYLFRL